MPRNIYPHTPLFSKTAKYLCASFVPIEQQINSEENTPAFVALNEEQNNALYWNIKGFVLKPLFCLKRLLKKFVTLKSPLEASGIQIIRLSRVLRAIERAPSTRTYLSNHQAKLEQTSNHASNTYFLSRTRIRARLCQKSVRSKPPRPYRDKENQVLPLKGRKGQSSRPPTRELLNTSAIPYHRQSSL